MENKDNFVRQRNPSAIEKLVDTGVAIMVGTIAGIAGLGAIFLVSSAISGIGNIAIQSIKEKQHIKAEYRKAYSDLFGHSYSFYPLADINHDDIVSFEEQTEAWKKMGYRGSFIETGGEGQFPVPTVEELRRARSFYITEDLSARLKERISQDKNWEDVPENKKRDLWRQELKAGYFEQIREKGLTYEDEDSLKRYVSDLIDNKIPYNQGSNQ